MSVTLDGSDDELNAPLSHSAEFSIQCCIMEVFGHFGRNTAQCSDSGRASASGTTIVLQLEYNKVSYTGIERCLN